MIVFERHRSCGFGRFAAPVRWSLDAIASDLVNKLGIEIKIQFLANDTGKEATHRCGCQPVALTTASIVQPSVDRSRASTRACLESARAPDVLVDKADDLATGKTFEVVGLFVLAPTYLALTDRVAADFEARCLVVAAAHASLSPSSIWSRS